MNSPYVNKKFIIDTNNAPRAIGPYSQAVGFNGLLFVSGQIPVDPVSGEVSKGGIEAQTRLAMNNLQAVLMAAGLDFSHVLKVTLYLRNMNDYELVNDVYSLFFDHSPPARVCVEVSRLPQDVLVEVDAIAAAPTDYVARTADEDDTSTDHPGPDDWEAQHMAEAEQAHREALANAEAQKEDDDDKQDGDSADDGDQDDDSDRAPELDASDANPATEELSVDDLEEASDPDEDESTPPLPSASKIKLPKPPKSGD